MTEPLHIGFTGTRKGMTPKQSAIVMRIAKHAGPDAVWHMGDCIGADMEAATIVDNVGATVVGHPPDIDTLRAFWPYKAERKPKPYLTRNCEIVDESHWLLAAPNGPEVRRSGTWFTVRYCKRKKGSGLVVYPSGRVEHF